MTSPRRSKPQSKPASGRPPAVPPAQRDWWLLLSLPALVAIVLAAYHPAWHGGILWDDDGHLTRPELRSAQGLWRIWFELGATQQYYPLVHTAFWIIARVWGQDPLAYHLLNIVLHAGSAFLIVIILRRLALPGALLAGVIFALHPIQVESVAWMTELKNTLSGVLYFGAVLVYLQFDRTRRMALYALATGLFALALLSKTVAATLPAGLLVIFWYQRGTLSWRRDVVPLVPYLGLSIAAGLTTAWVERNYIGAQGAAFDLTLIERCLVAGRAITFYLGKLLWPANLIFMYPRWNVSQEVWWQYLYPVGVAFLFLLLWRLRNWSRGPCAALMYFVVTLAPALGFVNVFPFKYSFVADHFQYLAGIGVIALGSAAIVRSAGRWVAPKLVETAAIVLFGTLLGVLTWNQSRQYADAEALYDTTLARNPQSWLAHNNLAMIELRRPGGGGFEKAWAHFQEAMRIESDEPLVRNNVGTTLMQMGRLEEALEQHREAVRLAPGYAEAHGNVGADLQRLGRYEEAARAYRIALDIKPSLGIFHANLGVTLEKLGRTEEASAEIREALKINPDSVEDHNALGDALLRVGKLDEAIGHYWQAVSLDPTQVLMQDNLGYALFMAGQLEEAERVLRGAIRLQPGDAAAHDNLGNVLQRLQRMDEALAEYERALTTGTPANLADIHNDMGVALARLGRRDQAITHFQEALKLRPTFPAAQANLSRAVSTPR
jgi:protein O-mannosyl-transferase